MMLDDADQKLVNDVREFGWHSLHVFSDNEGPGFTFSVGFWETLHSPEVIVFGLKREVMHNMLWEVFRQIQAGRELKDGIRWSNLIEGFDCVSRPVHVSQIRDYFGTALWYRHYRTGLYDLYAYQMFWPGKSQGLYPWEADCDEIVREYQPLLYLQQGTGLA